MGKKKRLPQGTLTGIETRLDVSKSIAQYKLEHEKPEALLAFADEVKLMESNHRQRIKSRNKYKHIPEEQKKKILPVEKVISKSFLDL